MKHLVLISTVLLTLIGCSSESEVSGGQYYSYFIDVTEEHHNYPEDPKKVLEVYGLHKPDVRNGGLGFCLNILSNRSINAVVEFVLGDVTESQKSNTHDDSRHREETLFGWMQQVIEAIDQLEFYSTTPELSHSLILEPVTAELARMASLPYEKRYLVLYSNLYENSALGSPTYEGLDLTEGSDERKAFVTSLKTKLDYGNLLSLKGIEMIIIYTPVDFDDDQKFTSMLSIVQELYEPLGCSVSARASL